MDRQIEEQMACENEDRTNAVEDGEYPGSTHISQAPLQAGPVPIDCYRYDISRIDHVFSLGLDELGDADGDIITRGQGVERMDPEIPVVIHVIRDALEPADVARLLRKVAEWIESEGLPQWRIGFKIPLAPGDQPDEETRPWT